MHQRADGYLDVDLKTLSTFPFDQRFGTLQEVPKTFRDLDGKKVALVGEMYVTNNTGPRLEKFDLVYSIAKCCFTGEPQIQHFIKSTPGKGQPLPYYDGTVRVKGTLRVNVVHDAGKVTGVYHLAVDSIEPV
jgi:hypothetical protein